MEIVHTNTRCGFVNLNILLIILVHITHCARRFMWVFVSCNSVIVAVRNKCTNISDYANNKKTCCVSCSGLVSTSFIFIMVYNEVTIMVLLGNLPADWVSSITMPRYST